MTLFLEQELRSWEEVGLVSWVLVDFDYGIIVDSWLTCPAFGSFQSSNSCRASLFRCCARLRIA
jgi:hypothetical protein